jgi:hypothetical protein
MPSIEEVRNGRFSNYSRERCAFHPNGNNHRVHQRLMYVLLCYLDAAPPSGKKFNDLAMEAVKKIPFI